MRLLPSLFQVVVGLTEHCPQWSDGHPLSCQQMMQSDTKPLNTLVLRPDLGNNSSLVDVDDSLKGTPTANKTRTKIASGSQNKLKNPTTPVPDKTKCPCWTSDKSSIKVICSKCKQHWHQKCCNLLGLNAVAIKKLERWLCPCCFICPVLSNVPATMYSEFQSVKDCLLNRTNENADLRQDIATLHSLVLDMSKKPIAKEFPASPPFLEKLEENITTLTEKLSNFEQTPASKTLQHEQKPPDTIPALGASTSPERMSPNTQSPSFSLPVTPCEPYLEYCSESIPNELKTELLEHVKTNEENLTSLPDSSRDILYYGEHSYKYTGVEHPKKEMPPVISKLLSVIKEKHTLSKDNIELNSCLITRYRSKTNHIPMHRDDEPVIDPNSLILTVSLGAPRKMTFENNDNSKTNQIILEDRSLLTCSRYSQDFWKHGIHPEENSNDKPPTNQEEDSQIYERISFTFRNISPYFINSTVIYGDSNTTHLRFGSDRGTLGVWMPGKRVKAGHIEALPAATDIGPYRNIVLHTGINNVNAKYSKSDTYLLHYLESRCKEIGQVYPKARVYLSTLLPTRSRQMNRRVEEFNQGILDISFRLRNVMLVDNSSFGIILSDEYGRWDSSKNQPLTSDALHLGKNGIRKFAMNIKSTIFNRRTSQSRARFDASGGEYRSAFGRQGSKPREPQGFVGFR